MDGRKASPGLDRDQEDHTERAMESSVLAWSCVGKKFKSVTEGGLR